MFYKSKKSATYLSIKREPTLALMKGPLQWQKSLRKENSSTEFLLIVQRELQGANFDWNEIGEFEVEDVSENRSNGVFRDAGQILNLLW